MTTAEALLAVLAPLATFLSGLGTLAVRGHFRFVDRLELRLGGYLDKSLEIQAETKEEMRLSRLHREAQDEETAVAFRELEAELGRKIEDRRLSDLRAAIEEIRAAKKAKSDPPGPFPTFTAEPPEEPRDTPAGRRRTRTDPSIRPTGAVPAAASRVLSRGR